MNESNSLITDKYDPSSPEAQHAASQLLSIGDLQGSPSNLRKSFPPGPLEQLAESIRQHGVFTPILVRLWPESYPWQGPKYEIVCGERRWRASKMADKLFIPATVRELSDEEVIALQIIENLQREDINELEEADGYASAIKNHGFTVESLAESIKKSKGYIYARLKLQSLRQAARDAFLAKQISASVALLLARIPSEELQNKATQYIITGDQGEPLSVRASIQYLQHNFTFDLTKAVFPINDANLIATAGECESCPKRSGNQQESYAAPKHAKASADVCTDPDCYAAKRKAHSDIIKTTAEEAGRKVITGDDTKKIAPYGINCGLAGDYKLLDDTCYQVSGYPKYRSLIGDDKIKVILVEDKHSGTFAEVIKLSDFKEELAAKGFKPQQTDSQRNKEAEAKAKCENAYRWELLTRINFELRLRMNAGASTGKFLVVHGIPLEEAVMVAGVMFDRTEFNTQTRLTRLYGYISEDSHKSVNALEAEIKSMNEREISLMLLNLAMIGESFVHAYYNYGDPLKMLAIAKNCGLDPAAIKASVEAQIDEKAKKPKGAKKAAQAEKDIAPKTKEAEAPAPAATDETHPVEAKTTPATAKALPAAKKAAPASETKAPKAKAKPAKAVTKPAKTVAKPAKAETSKAPAAKKAAQAQKAKANPKSRGQASLAENGKSKKVINEKPKGAAKAGGVPAEAVRCDKTADMFQGMPA